jgi:serine/threonine-protein kinase
LDRHLGRTVLGFRIEAPLGEGSFGIVYRAVHVDLGREVAIKILRPEHARDQNAVQRFLREAKLVCQLAHPNIVEVENAGMLDDEPYYVMELVSGRSLAKRLAEDGPLRVRELAAVFGPLASALDAAHAKGVIHRDLKPHNIMITEESGAIVGTKLFDFGIAKLLESRESGSQTGGMMGTPHFMAPEQARDAKNVDARADVYGYAATFFAAATGRRPFEGDSITEILIAVQQDPVAPISTWLAEATPALDAIVARCLAKDPAARPSSVGAAAKELLAELAKLPPDARASRIRRGADALMTIESGPTEEPGRTESLKGSIDPIATPRRRGFLVGAMLIVAAGVAGTIYVMKRGGDDPTHTIAPAPIDAPARPDAISVSDATIVAVDAPLPPDATPPVDARDTHDIRHRHDRPAPPDARPAPLAAPDAAPKSAQPAVTNCARADFAAVYDAESPEPTAVRAALRHLKECREAGLISQSDFDRYQAALVGKL